MNLIPSKSKGRHWVLAGEVAAAAVLSGCGGGGSIPAEGADALAANKVVVPWRW